MKRQLRRVILCLTLAAALAGLAPAPAAGFQDVPDGHWAEESIRRSVELGLFQGQTPSRFGLGGELARGTFAVVLCRLYGWETPAPEKPSFQDVKAEDTWAGAVEALLSHGVITDQRPDFRPGEALTREELAVMLVRSLGYGVLAGLVQELPTHFQDLHTNTGYIAMAYNLGLTNGTSATTFSPRRAVTREEAAVTLIRLYDRLHAAPPEITVVLSAPEEGEALPDLTGLDTAAVPVGRLMGLGGKPSITPAMPESTAAALRGAAEQAGAGVFLHVTAGPTALDAPFSETAALLADAVRQGGWDGLMLDVPELKRDRRIDLTELVAALRAALGEEIPLYLAVEAPPWQGREYGGYDFAALDAYVDRLVLRVAPYEAEPGGGFPLAPVVPLEEVYYALVSMKGRVELEQLSLLVDLQPAVWGMDGRPRELKRQELEAVLDSGRRQYSQRYGCAYLEGRNGDEPVAVWYLDQEAILARRQMIQAFGIDHLCITGLSGSLASLVS